MSHISPKKKGWVPCEFAAMGDCVSKDDYCPIGIKDPENCEKYHRKMVDEGEETAEEKVIYADKSPNNRGAE